MTEPAAPLPGNLRRVRDLAAELGLELRACLPAAPLPAENLRRLDAWLAAGHHGEMGWLERSRPALEGPHAWKPWAGSLLLFAAAYPRAAGGFRGGGRVARYALGRDYHHVLGRRLEKLGRRMVAEGVTTRFRGATDAAPLLERDWAVQGSVGFRGKNTLLLDQRSGPWQLLAELLLDAELPEWRPSPPTADCGSCTACLEACPTDAFPEPFVLDARRCISYLTIELRGPIPRPLRPAIGDWVFGCDVCLEVCPFGSRAPDRAEDWGSLPALEAWSLEDLLACTEEEFESAFRGSPIRRPGWAGLLRNACVALGNLGRGQEALAGALRHTEPLVRGHAAWALGRLGEKPALEAARRTEGDPGVLAEIEAALSDES